MNVYCKIFPSGRISHTLITTQLNSGKWAIATKNYKDDSYTPNINYPLFNTEAEAETYLIENFKEA